MSKLLLNSPFITVKSITEEIEYKKHIRLNDKHIRGIELIVHMNTFVNSLNEEINSFDYKVNEHTELLESLWDTLKPDVRRSALISSEWSELGFQGKDPSTDFRAVGLLGLKGLVWLSKNQKEFCDRVLVHSYDPLKYPGFAITGINFIHDIVQMTRRRELDYMYFKYGVELGTLFHLTFSYWKVFDKLWEEANPENVMQFNVIRQRALSVFRLEMQYRELIVAYHSHIF